MLGGEMISGVGRDRLAPLGRRRSELDAALARAHISKPLGACEFERNFQLLYLHIIHSHDGRPPSLMWLWPR